MWKQPRCLLDEWINKMCSIHKMENHLVLKRESLPSETWVDLENIMLSETNQTEKDKGHMTSSVCGIWDRERERKTKPKLIDNRGNWWLPEVHACSVVSDSLWSHRPQPVRLLYPWNFQGRNTRVGCHSLLQGIFLSKKSNPSLLPLTHWQADS